MNSSAHIDNKGKYILVLGRGPTQGLVEHSLTDIFVVKIYVLSVHSYIQ